MEDGKLSRASMIAITLLRVVVGWHFLYEGIAKLTSPSWSAAGYLKQARGPFADLFKWLANQPNGGNDNNDCVWAESSGFNDLGCSTATNARAMCEIDGWHVRPTDRHAYRFVYLADTQATLEGECQAGAAPGRSTAMSFVLHAVVVVFLAVVPARIIHANEALLHLNPEAQYQVIYYSGHELPQMLDAGGAQAGKSGRSGGRELFNPTQTIRIARGEKLVDTIADAPSLKLPVSHVPVANLLSMPAGDAGPVPAAGIHGLVNPNLLLPQINPAPVRPDVQRDKLPAVPALAAGALQPVPNARREVAGLKAPDLGALQVVPPPISSPARETTAVAKLTLPMPTAVAPPPAAWKNVSDIGVVGLGGAKDVIPPAVQPGGQSLNGSALGALGGAAESVAPPPPQVGTGTGEGGLVGSALKTLGAALGALNRGNGTGGGGTGIVLSATPGGAVGVPAHGGAGSLAMSPNGGPKLGFGGSGEGTGIGNGKGSGSGATGEGSGAAKDGSGLGLGAINPGTSLGSGPGGSGYGQGTPGGLPGVTVIGGNVTLPSFGSPEDRSAFPTREQNRDPGAGPTVTIIASPRAGGALNAYGAFQGTKVYTIYFDTRLGMAVLQYAEHATLRGSFEQDLSAPQALNVELPADLPRARVLLAFVLDRSGTVRNMRVVEASRPALNDKVLAAVQSWRFRPAMRGTDVVEVNAILGFDIDTR
jgi:TonB family protein